MQQQRLCRGVGHIDVPQVDEAVAMGPRHFRVDVGDNASGHIAGRLAGLDGDAQGAVAVTVRGGDLNQGRVNAGVTAPEQLGNFGEKNRHIVGAALVDQVSGHLAGEKAAVAQVPVQGRIRQRLRMLQVQLHDGHVLQRPGMYRQGLQQHRGRGRHGVAPQVFPRTNGRHRFQRRLDKQRHRTPRIAAIQPFIPQPGWAFRHGQANAAWSTLPA